MRNIDDILKDFTDTELAYLNKYQLDNYLASTQTKIRDYIFKKRGLTQISLDNLIVKNDSATFNDNQTRCPRCKTDKVRTAKVNWAIPLFRAGAEDEYAMLHEIQTGHSYKKEMATCNVCGYILYNPNNEKRPIYKKLADFILDSPIWSIFRRQ